jgi:hypothetical protein
MKRIYCNTNPAILRGLRAWFNNWKIAKNFIRASDLLKYIHQWAIGNSYDTSIRSGCYRRGEDYFFMVREEIEVFR